MVDTADFIVTRHGLSLFTFAPQNDDAYAWLSGHTDDNATWWCRSLVVESRFALDLAESLQAEGFTVE